MIKIIFLVVNEPDTNERYPVYKHLIEHFNVDVLFIGTGDICLGNAERTAEERMEELGLPYKTLKDYGTKNMAKILDIEKPDVLLLGNDQEFLRRAFVYACRAYNIPTLLFRLAVGRRTENVPSIAYKRTIFKLKNRKINLIYRSAYLIKTVISIGWSPISIARMLVQEIKTVFSVDDNVGVYGCTAVIVSGTWERDTLVGHGVKKSKIIITGCPTMNGMLKNE